jgi:hypothetical protein
MPSDTTPSRRTNYVEPAALRCLVMCYHETRTVSEDLAAVLVKIAGGVWDRYHYTDSREDFVQDVVLHFLQRPLEVADPTKNLFAFFTTCAIRFGSKLREKAQGDRRRFNTYAAELVESGRQIPSKRGESMDVAEFSDDLDPKGKAESDRGGAWFPGGRRFE